MAPSHWLELSFLLNNVYLPSPWEAEEEEYLEEGTSAYYLINAE